jgi:nitrogen fixation/metabolism regulation signal transduction histidine kinase
MMKWLERLLPISAFLLLFAFALYLAGDGREIGPAFVPWASALMIAAGVAFGAVLGLLARRGMGLYRDWRSAAPGAGLRVRLLGLLLLLTLPPWVLLYGFSLRFLNASVDSWFRVDVEQALNAARDLARDSLQSEQQNALQRTRQIAQKMEATIGLDSAISQELDDSRALQLSMFAENDEVLASASADLRFIYASAPTSAERERANAGAFTEVLGQGNQDIVLRVLAPMSNARLLEARFAASQNWAARADQVEKQLFDYRQLKYLRTALKTTLLFVLSFVLLLGVLIALYLAFAITKRLVAPLTALVEANRKVAAGDYSARVTEGGATELALLARSFNQMTSDLALANDHVQQSGAQALIDRHFLETVLERIRSGVLVLERETLRTVNVAASELFEMPLDALIGKDLSVLGREHPRLKPLTEILLMYARGQQREWRAEIALDAVVGKQLLLLRGARLPDDTGQVIIADDEGDVARTQRESAWGEVARRLAHEIKNPLTPIQLAAERLRKKYLTTLPDSDREVLDRATRTIVAQVESLKTMVNAFSDYSRPPQVTMQAVDLPELAREVAELYASESQQVSFSYQFAKNTPKLKADSGRMRQLLHNVIKNAQEASEGRPVLIEVATQVLSESHRQWYELSISDNGPGLPEALRERLFEPYTSSKVKGTGLGLAIVKKIVEEHGGQIRAENRKPNGVTMRVRLPLGAESASSATRGKTNG